MWCNIGSLDIWFLYSKKKEYQNKRDWCERKDSTHLNLILCLICYLCPYSISILFASRKQNRFVVTGVKLRPMPRITVMSYERHGVSNYGNSSVIWLISSNTLKLHIGDPLSWEVTIAFPLIWTTNAENVSMSGRHHGPLARYVTSRVAQAPGMPGTFSPPPSLRETAS